MSPFFIFQFAITPVSGAVFIINKKLHIDLLLQLIRVALIGSSFVISRLLSLSFDFTIFSYSISLVGFYLITFISSIIIMIFLNRITICGKIEYKIIHKVK